MAEIVPVGNGRYTLNQGTYRLDADFFKVKRLAEGSNYYLLWPDAQMNDFYLYNTQKQTYAFNRKLFKKTEYYSEDSLSFVAYRSDHNYAYMFYEDGYIDKEYVCGYIGEEYKGVRPIKTYGGKWLYYNVYMRKPIWKVEYGYKLKEGWSLGKKLDYNCFIVNRADGGMCIWRYNEKAHKVEYHSSTYDSIKECADSPYLICKKRRENRFELFLCRKFRNLSNPQWRTPNFLFKGNYLFYNPSPDMPENGSTGWQIFNAKDGSPAFYLDWENIRLYDWSGDFYMLVDIDTEKDKKVFLSDIEKSAKDMKALSQSLYAKSTQEKTIDVHNEKETSQTNIDEINIEENKESNVQTIKKETTCFQCENHLPPSIKYCTTIDMLEKITSDGYLLCNRNCSDILDKEYICWIVPKSNSLIITQYIRRNTHKVVYYKTYEQANFVDKGIELPTRIVPITLEDAQEDTLVEQLEKALGFATTIQSSKVCAETVRQEEDNNVAESYEMEDKPIQTSQQDKVCFTFDDKGYALNLGDVWDIGNVFYRRKYFLKKSVLAILLTPLNLVSIEYKQDIHPHYKIIGEGDDMKYDQYFSMGNKAIRDNARQILLFKRENDKICLVDEVRCCACTIKTQKLPNKDKERKVILFDLVSLRQVNEWYFKR